MYDITDILSYQRIFRLFTKYITYITDIKIIGIHQEKINYYIMVHLNVVFK